MPVPASPGAARRREAGGDARPSPIEQRHDGARAEFGVVITAKGWKAMRAYMWGAYLLAAAAVPIAVQWCGRLHGH